VKHIRHPHGIPHRLLHTKATSWSGFNAQGKQDIVASLMPAQNYLCAYCQIRLDSEIGYHIEHVINKSIDPTLTFEWPNLVLSCTHSESIDATRMDGGVSCGHSAGKSTWPALDSQFIQPTEPDCERYFEYLASDGSVQPATNLNANDTKRATYTRDLLNLNCRRLNRQRKDMLEEGFRIIRQLMSDPTALKHFLDCDLGETNHKLNSFHTARVQQFRAFA
jgi:uncharacterized protein (TIGR02646 family)